MSRFKKNRSGNTGEAVEHGFENLLFSFYNDPAGRRLQVHLAVEIDGFPDADFYLGYGNGDAIEKAL